MLSKSYCFQMKTDGRKVWWIRKDLKICESTARNLLITMSPVPDCTTSGPTSTRIHFPFRRLNTSFRFYPSIPVGRKRRQLQGRKCRNRRTVQPLWRSERRKSVEKAWGESDNTDPEIMTYKLTMTIWQTIEEKLSKNQSKELMGYDQKQILILKLYESTIVKTVG
jgi:hypothetical protein